MSLTSPIRKSDMPENRHQVLVQRFNNHLDDYRKHIEEDHTKWEEIGIVTQELVTLAAVNTKSIESTTASVQALTESTKGLVALQTTGQTIAKLGIWLKNIMIF